MGSVAGMVDEWSWLNERAVSQAASKNMALHLEERLERRLLGKRGRQLGLG